MESLISAFGNRFRGDDSLTKGLWYVLMTYLIASKMDLQPTELSSLSRYVGWLVVLALYSVFPWHAVFSAGHGRAPGREDSWYMQWMQRLAGWITDKFCDAQTKQLLPYEYWMLFGRIYGAIRFGLPIIPVLTWLLWGNWYHLITCSIFWLSIGLIYWFWGKYSKDNFVGFSELTIGYALLAQVV